MYFFYKIPLFSVTASHFNLYDNVYIIAGSF